MTLARLALSLLLLGCASPVQQPDSDCAYFGIANCVPADTPGATLICPEPEPGIYEIGCFWVQS